jgi:gliding motility-associated-like protein
LKLSCTIYLSLLCLLPVLVKAQVGALLLNVTSGDSAANPGPPLPIKNTPFNYSTDSCPTPGKYTVTNNLYKCAATRMGRSIDNTPNSKHGYMMVVNDTISRTSKILYIDTLKAALCPGTIYRFSAAFLNVAIPGYCSTFNIHFPAFTFNVETTSGQVLASMDTGPMPYDYVPPPPPTPFTPKFHVSGVSFMMPPGINGLVLKIKDDSSGYTPCGYEFAIDDIQFSATGPKASIAFDDDIYGTELVKAVCFQDKKSISFTGSIVAPGFNNPAVQWQQSIDNGNTWADIPGATNYSFSKVFSVPDTFLIRMRASEANKIGNPNCSVVSNTRRVEVDGLPSVDSISTNSPVCSGANLQFNASGGASYIWTGPNGFYDNVSYAHIYHATLADSGTYFVQIRSFGGCVASGSTHVTILGTADVTAGPPQSICKGNTVQLNATGGDSYIWRPATGLSDPKIANPKAAPRITTTYTVTVTNNFGCSDSASVKITLLNTIAVKAVISGSNFLCKPSDSATFKDMSIGNIAKWNWDFGNNMKSILQNPPVQNYFIESNATDYTVNLIVTDSAGCADTTFHVMKVENNCYIAVPNAFTPNGDGLNDYLYPLNAYKATDLTFRVFNRDGQLVFETTDWTKKWDGTKAHDPMPAGVYVWMLSYTDPSDKKVFLKGYTVLLR